MGGGGGGVEAEGAEACIQRLEELTKSSAGVVSSPCSVPELVLEHSAPDPPPPGSSPDPLEAATPAAAAA